LEEEEVESRIGSGEREIGSSGSGENMEGRETGRVMDRDGGTEDDGRDNTVVHPSGPCTLVGDLGLDGGPWLPVGALVK
jgi:hypothetical protein